MAATNLKEAKTINASLQRVSDTLKMGMLQGDNARQIMVNALNVEL